MPVPAATMIGSGPAGSPVVPKAIVGNQGWGVMVGSSRRRALTVALVFCSVLASCGGGGGGSAGDGSDGGEVVAGDWFPLTAGARWRYDVDGEFAYSVRVVGPGSVANAQGTLVESIGDSDLEGSRVLYALAADGVRQYAVPPPADPVGRSVDGRLVFALPARIGEPVTQVDTSVDSRQDFDGDGRTDRFDVRAEAVVVGLESVTTPAGTFERTLLQRQSITQTLHLSGESRAITVRAQLDVWYADGIGPVQSTYRVFGNGLDAVSTERLVAYGVGSRRSDAVPPVVVSVAPTQPVRQGAVTIAATLSERLDRGSVGTANLSLRDASGAAIRGRVELSEDGTTVRFVPDAPLAIGTYTATLSGVTDAVGNALAQPRTWTVAIDESAPGVVGSSPANGAVDVPAAIATITVDFGEPIDGARTISAFNTRIVDDATGVPISATVSVAGTRLTLVIRDPLLERTTYRVSVEAWDLAGNVTGHTIVFRTVQGRFAAAAPLIAGVEPTALAVADLDGDGIADILLATSGNAPSAYAHGVFLLAGRPDGTLDAPVRLPIAPAGSCQIVGLAVGDLDGDSRKDVAVGINGCGVQVLRQTGTRTFAAGEFLPRYGIERLVATDLDRDGTLELLAGGFDATIQIWKRAPGGTMVASSTVTLSGPGRRFRDFGVGDVDGDGRPDIVGAIWFGQPGDDVAVLRQRADGTFASETVSASGSVYGFSRIAVGDLDGDGRAEVVGSTPETFSVLLRPDATGTFAAPVLLPGERLGLESALADVDGDGRVDIVTAHYNPSLVGIRYQRAGDVFSNEEVFRGSTFTVNGGQALAVADVTRDGRPDLLFDGVLARQIPIAAAGNAARFRFASAVLERAAAAAAVQAARGR